MRSGGKLAAVSIIFFENQLTKLAHLVQFDKLTYMLKKTQVTLNLRLSS